MKPRKQLIEDKLLSLGIKPSVKGFRYLVDAVDLWIERNGDLSMTKELYPEIADKHGATSSRVERAIRHAIETAADCTSYEDMASILGTTTNMNKGKLTNGEFIATLALLVEREERMDRS